MGYYGLGVRICAPAKENRAGERESKFDVGKGGWEGVWKAEKVGRQIKAGRRHQLPDSVPAWLWAGSLGKSEEFEDLVL